MGTRRAPRAAGLAALGLVAAAVTLSSCGGGASGSGGGSAGGQGASAPRAEGSRGGSGTGSGGADARSKSGDFAGAVRGREVGGTDLSVRALPPGRDIVYRGQLTVRVRNVADAVRRAESRVTSVDGVVFSEESATDPGRPSRSSATLTLRVPPTQFRPLLAELAGLGKQLSRSQTAQDVTTEVVDLDSRLSSQRRSVARIRTLLDEARTIGQIVQVEGELARREADLESLEAQRKKLRDITDLATIELSLVAPEVQPPPPVVEDGNLGFTSGVRGGWDAFVSIVLVALTVAGALLPFAITVTLLGVPAWFLARSRRRRPSPTPTPSP